MKNPRIVYSLIGFIALLFVSCDKGYEVRFTNYYIEPVDSVIIGSNKIVFKNIELQATTGYEKISKGKYSIQCVSHGKKRFFSSISIPGSGKGKRTIQIDGINQISILEE
jgi:hypothetical protein